MRVAKQEARDFYEQEAIECAWDIRSLERQIHSQYFERLLKSQHPQRMKERTDHELSERSSVVETLKNPYVLEFLGLPDVTTLHESQLEAAIITHLQHFMLELGKGFAFVARQKRMRYEETNLYVDLVFYNCILKCYLLIDLKMGELSYQDVGQMDGYVRMFDDTYTADDDNPTIGLILCTEKNEAIAKYSVLKDQQQLFASKYMLYLPTEEELQLEIGRERKAIESALADRYGNSVS
jgi:predicted nuclease of restriction endonuclease-like (RecB) superfamily